MPNGYAGTSSLGELVTLALHQAANSKCEQARVFLVGKLKTRAGQAVNFFLELLHTIFSLVLTGGQVTSAV